MRRLAGCKRAGSWPEQKGHLGSRRSRRFKKLSQHRCCPELGDGVKFLEGRCESIRQAPHRSGLEFLVLGVEIHLVDPACQMSSGVPCGKDGSISELALGAFQFCPGVYIRRSKNTIPERPVFLRLRGCLRKSSFFPNS